MGESGLSRGTQALWGYDDRRRRGPKPSVTIHEIAATATDLADEGGLEAVTMAAVAGRLDLTTMALYRHVESRQDLLAVAGDVALGLPPTPGRRVGWRRRLSQWAWAEFRQLSAHPWVLQVVLTGPPSGPNTLAWMDAGMQAIGVAGLDGQAAASSLLVVDGYVRSTVAQAQQYGRDDNTGWARALRTVVDPEQLPAVSQALDAGVFEDDEPFPSDQDVDFGLSVILDGIEQLVVARRR